MLTIEKEEAVKISPEQAQRSLEWVLQSPGIANNVKASIYASLWLLSVETFRNTEDERLVKGTYESTLDEHRYALSALIGRGEGVILVVKQNGLMPNAPFTVDDLKATLESLHDSFRGQHRKCNSEQTNKEIAKLFE
jgi:hypothetical protein